MRVDFRASGGRDWLRVVVTDTGIGVGADRLELLFEPFTQADSTTTRLYGGTGLGLAISRRLAEGMGGSLAMRSEPGAGTTVELPAHARNLSILIVEDTPVNQKVAQHLLARFGFRSEVAASGYEALHALEQRSYDLVLMDVQMPQMDGLEATRQIRLRWPDAGPRIIAMTANVAPEDVRRCSDAGVDGLLAKPIVVESLAKVLRSLVADPPGGLGRGRTGGPSGRGAVVCAARRRDGPRDRADVLADVDTAVPALSDGCRDHDRAVLAATAHRLKSSARSLGAEHLGELLDSIELQAPAAEWPVLTELVGQVQAQRSGVHEELVAQLQA